MNYHKYDSAAFATDQYFIQWVLSPSAEHHTFWDQWLKEHPEQYATIQEAKQIVLQLAQDDDEILDWELDAMWQNITETRKAPVRQPKVIPIRRSTEAYVRWGMGIAAAVMLLVFAGFAWYEFVFHAPVEYATKYGERRTIMLPDSSMVVLNANSKITLPANWAESEDRKVKLAGEAFFSVTHKKNKQKFLVETPDGVMVEVLGTEFNVSDRGSKNRVVLSSGKVKLHIGKGSAKKQLLMSPGELVEISEKTGAYQVSIVTPDHFTSWKDNRLVLVNTSLQEIAAMLQYNYGYPVEYADKGLAHLKVTASFEGIRMEDVLLTLSETLDIEMVKENYKIIIRKKPTNK